MSSLVLVLAACGQAEVDSEEIGNLSQAACFDCDPLSLNARGVVAEEGGSICLMTAAYGYVCPLYFTNVAGGVNVTLTDEHYNQKWTVPVTAFYNGNAITLKGISASQTSPKVTYAGLFGIQVALTGTNLSKVVLRFNLGPEPIDLRLNPPGAQATEVDGVYENQLQFMNRATGVWESLCKDHEGSDDPASLYSGARFNPMSALRTDAAEITQLSCKKGGITTCMQWGYRPWENGTNETNGALEGLSVAHVSCIQMKRAAYCGTESFTANGTAIALDDRYQIHPLTPSVVEAVWGPYGAKCVNMQNRRHMDINFSGFCQNGPVQPCLGNELSWWTGGGYTASGILRSF